MFWTKSKRHLEKVAFCPSEATVEVSRGSQSSKGPLEGRSFQDGWGEGRESPGPAAEDRRKLGTH